VKRKETPAEGSGFDQGAPARVTPLDIQEKTFRTARLGGGYQVREVDEFLDQVTDALSALIAENERLRSASAKSPSAPGAPAPAPSAIGAGDRAAIESFLQRERTFLQSLGGLVQEHAEVLRGMARSARRGPSQEGSPEPAAAHAVASPEAVETDDVAPGGEPQEAAVVEETVAAAPTPEAEPEAPIEVEGDDVSASKEQAPPEEEPIRLEETQPVRSRTEGEQEPSLRELFWGED
jgi:DivIVA domain-containing protein